jgi:dTDP-4-dehydrorhamnose reductase
MGKKVAIIGSNGQLGSDLAIELASTGYEVAGLTHADIEVTNIDSVRSVLSTQQPSFVLNTAAFHNVPKCEAEPSYAFQVNALGALNIAQVCNDIDATSVYFSTDYVFDGAKKAPYFEEDAPNPLNIYASTKLLGEYYTLNYARRGFVVRISGIYGAVPCRAKGGNFVTTMIKLAKEKPEVKVVDDEILTPTPTREIARTTSAILESGAYGVFHLTSEGECSWYEFARVIFETLKMKTPLYPCSVSDFPTPVNRPFYSVLENKRMKDLQIDDMPHWKDSLISFLKSQYS